MTQRTLNDQHLSEILDLARSVVTDEAREQYRERGWWVSPPFLDEALLDSAERGAERIYRGESDRPLPDGATAKGWTPQDGDVLRKNDQASLLVDDLAELTTAPLLGAVAALVSGAQEIRLWHDQLLYKPSVVAGDAPKNVGWHTDRQYWQVCTSDDMLTAWVPFHDVHVEHGPVQFVDGSHRWADTVTGDFFDADLSTLEGLTAGREVTISQAVVPRGAASFHDCRLIHGSGPNVSGVPRRSIAIHLQDGANDYAGAVAEDGTPLRHGMSDLSMLKTGGAPDFTDPGLFPTLWKSPARD